MEIAPLHDFIPWRRAGCVNAKFVAPFPPCIYKKNMQIYKDSLDYISFRMGFRK
jgi:hypothetical protein